MPKLCLLIAVAVQLFSHSPVKAQAISEHHLYSLLFKVLRSGQPPAWPLEYRMNYLTQHGFTESEARVVIRAADAFGPVADQFDIKLKESNDRYVGRHLSPEAVAEWKLISADRQNALMEIVAHLKQTGGPDVSEKLERHIEWMRPRIVLAQQTSEHNHARAR